MAAERRNHSDDSGAGYPLLMRPILFSVGPVVAHSWGVLFGLGLALGYAVLYKEHRRRGISPSLAARLYVVVVVSGVLGAKLASALADVPRFRRDPVAVLLAPQGLVWYGAVIGALVCVLAYLWLCRLPVASSLDSLGLALAGSYALGRLGCHLAGDGDYGRPTERFVGMLFDGGVIKPAQAAFGYFSQHPEVAQRWQYHQLTATIVGRDRFGLITEFDSTVRMHPTSGYEFMICAVVFGVLWATRCSWTRHGGMFVAVVLLMCAERFAIEFVGLNRSVVLGLTAVQLQSAVLIIGTLGVGLWSHTRGRFLVRSA